MSYEVFGLRLLSEIPLPELAEGGGSTWDVDIRRGRVPGEERAAGYHPLGEGLLLSAPGVARYLIEAGRKITVDASGEAEEASVRLYLLGSALGAVLHQRGLLPLHANAIDIGGSAAVFMGRSGAGKSTLAAWFLDRGYKVLSDDVCVVEKGDQGPIVHGGIPRLRLTPEALARTGRDAASYRRSTADGEKFDVPIATAGRASRALPLSQIYLLQQADGGAEKIELLRGVEAVEAVMANTYRGGLVGHIGSPERHMRDCLELVEAVPILRFTRSWDVTKFDEQARGLEAQLKLKVAQ